MHIFLKTKSCNQKPHNITKWDHMPLKHYKNVLGFKGKPLMGCFERETRYTTSTIDIFLINSSIWPLSYSLDHIPVKGSTSKRSESYHETIRDKGALWLGYGLISTVSGVYCTGVHGHSSVVTNYHAPFSMCQLLLNSSQSGTTFGLITKHIILS